MRPQVVILLLATCFISGAAVGLSIGTLTYGGRLATQNETIVQMSEELIKTRQIRDAWKKLAAACNSELNEDAK